MKIPKFYTRRFSVWLQKGVKKRVPKRLYPEKEVQCHPDEAQPQLYKCGNYKNLPNQNLNVMEPGKRKGIRECSLFC